MKQTSQGRAVGAYRKRLSDQGLARFEVLGLDSDRALIRSLAKALSDDGPDSIRIRTVMRSAMEAEPRKKGGILAALRSSPLVGAELDLTREHVPERRVDL